MMTDQRDELHPLDLEQLEAAAGGFRFPTQGGFHPPVFGTAPGFFRCGPGFPGFPGFFPGFPGFPVFQPPRFFPLGRVPGFFGGGRFELFPGIDPLRW